QIRDGAHRDALITQLRDAVLPHETNGPLAMVIGFTAVSTLGNIRATDVGSRWANDPALRPAYGVGTTVTLLWFLQSDPRECWSRFPAHTESYATLDAELVFAAPFIPTIVGTDTYVDQLR